LIWDRLPIALACAGLLAAIRSETARQSSDRATTALALVGAGSVAWWYLTGLEGPGDLRPYLLLQVLPLVLIPIWQYNGRAPRSQRLAFAAAIVLYVLAKLAEIGDHAIFAELGWISGHTVKHLLASAAAATIVIELVARVRRDTPAALQNEKREYIATARVNASSRAKA
jgi:hypothetical protein